MIARAAQGLAGHAEADVTEDAVQAALIVQDAKVKGLWSACAGARGSCWITGR